MTEQEKNFIEERVKQVQDNIAQAAFRSGRRPEEITLVAATKMNDADRVRYALACGINAAGENRVQELLLKYEAGAYTGKPLHFIGTLQTNKVKLLIGKVELIQSVGSIKLGKIIAKEALKHNLQQNILLEVNIGKEEAKSGIAPEDVSDVVAELSSESALHVQGLMAIPPISNNPGQISRYFTEMRQLFVDISAKKYDNVDMSILSMGMSNDYMEAIACGANMVRVGSAIFGARQY